MDSDNRYVTFEETLDETNDVGFATWMKSLKPTDRPLEMRKVVTETLSRLNHRIGSPPPRSGVVEIDKLLEKNLKRLFHSTWDAEMHVAFKQSHEAGFGDFFYVDQSHSGYAKLLENAEVNVAIEAQRFFQMVYDSPYSGEQFNESYKLALEKFVLFAARGEDPELAASFLGHLLRNAEYKNDAVRTHIISLLRKVCGPKRSQWLLIQFFEGGEVPLDFSKDKREHPQYDFHHNVMDVLLEKITGVVNFSLLGYLFAEQGLIDSVREMKPEQAKKLLGYARLLKENLHPDSEESVQIELDGQLSIEREKILVNIESNLIEPMLRALLHEQAPADIIEKTHEKDYVIVKKGQKLTQKLLCDLLSKTHRLEINGPSDNKVVKTLTHAKSLIWTILGEPPYKGGTI